MATKEEKAALEESTKGVKQALREHHTVGRQACHELGERAKAMYEAIQRVVDG